MRTHALCTFSITALLLVICGCDKARSPDRAGEHSAPVASKGSDDVSDVPFVSFALRFMSLNNLSETQLPMDAPDIEETDKGTGSLVVWSGHMAHVNAFLQGKWRPIPFAAVGQNGPLKIEYIFHKSGHVWQYHNTHITVRDMQAHVKDMPEDGDVRMELVKCTEDAHSACVSASSWKGADSPEALIGHAAEAVRRGYWEDFLACVVEREREELTIMNMKVHMATRQFMLQQGGLRTFERARVGAFVRKYELEGVPLDNITISAGTPLAEVFTDTQRLSLPNFGLGKVTAHDYLYFLGMLTELKCEGDTAKGLMRQGEDAEVDDAEVCFVKERGKWYLTNVGMGGVKMSKEDARKALEQLREMFKEDS